MELKEFLKNYRINKSRDEHGQVSEIISVELFKQLSTILMQVKNVYTNRNIELLKYASRLHDIGMYFEKTSDKPHNKIGAKLIIENKIDGLDDKENTIVANVIRYHRGSKPKEGKHKIYTSLDENSKNLVNIFASIIRIADALDYNHFALPQEIQIHMNSDESTLTLKCGNNIMLNVGFLENFEKKKKLFEKVFGLEVKLEI